MSPQFLFMTRVASSMLLWLISIALLTNAESVTVENFNVEKGTLILFGVTNTDITIAADSKGISDEGESSKEQKIFPISKFTACTLLGETQIVAEEGGSGKVEDKIDFSGLVRRWAIANSSASPRDAYSSLAKVFQDALRNFYMKHRNAPPSSTVLTCIGYEQNSVVEFNGTFYESSANMLPSTNESNRTLPPGRFVPLGINLVCRLLLLGGDKRFPEEFRLVPVVKKYSNLGEVHAPNELTTSDMLQLSRECLSATESKFALAIDPNAVGVGAPNSYAIISRSSGFQLLPDQ
jgi:hypothetical protein